MQDKNKKISGLILAGGKNSRLGEPKYFIKINGIAIIDRILQIFSNLFEEILIVANDRSAFRDYHGKYSKTSVVEDKIKDCGPIGGILTGLTSEAADYAFVAASDMPFLQEELIRKILIQAENMKVDCIVPKVKGKLEALHALYSKRILPRIEGNMKAGENSLIPLIQQSKTQFVDISDMDALSFTNINDRNDLLRARAFESSMLF